MTWTTRSLQAPFGIEILGLVPTATLADSEVGQLSQLVSEAGVAVLRGQTFDGPMLNRFASRFGAFADIPTKTGRDGDVFRISNLDADGKILPPDHEVILLNLANERWHSDRTFARPRGSYSMLYGRIVPREGACTEFCDTRRAFERLPEDEKRDLRTRTAKHSVLYSRIGSGVAWSDEQLAAYGQPVVRPLVHLHEESRRLALCLGSYAFNMSGLDQESSMRRLDQLVSAAAEPSEIYSHRWSPGDLLIWDNRCTMHRATPYDYLNERREMLAPPRVVDLADTAEPDAPDREHA